MRRLSDQARLEGMLALRKALDGVRRGQQAARAAGDEIVHASLSSRHRGEPSNRLRRAENERSAPAADRVDEEVAADEPGLVESEHDGEWGKGLDRIADSIERVAAQLDSYHHERAEHLDAIEFLLREMVIGMIPASAGRPIVLGGVIDRETMARTDREISLVDDGDALEVDVPVEVRSRFHDRWIGGFTIAETANSPGRRRYRLTRRSDGIPLPILFDECDVRAAADSHDKQHSPS
jgi:hypothetical protein